MSSVSCDINTHYTTAILSYSGNYDPHFWLEVLIKSDTHVAFAPDID